MRLIIDGDAFPNLLKPIVHRAIEKRKIETIVVSNKKISIGESRLVKYTIVSQGLDMADKHIDEMLQNDDIVITADIPLAYKVVSKNCIALDHRGILYTSDNIKQFLAMRNLMEEIRSSGEITKGPKPFDKKDIHAFSNEFQKLLTKKS